MAGIASTDIKLYQALYQSDELTAGGPPSPVVIVSDEINNLFENIARVDHIKGAVQLRKVFIRINSDADEIYAGSHVALMTAPLDPLVEVIIIPSGGHFETLENVLEYIHDVTQREFFGAFKLFEAATLGATSLKITDHKKQIFPVASNEDDLADIDSDSFFDGGVLPLEDSDPWMFVQPPDSYGKELGWSMIGVAIPARLANSTYYIELDNLLLRDFLGIRVLAKIGDNWQEWRSTVNNTVLQDISEDSSGSLDLTVSYSSNSSTGVALFALPDGAAPEPGSKIIVVYPCLMWTLINVWVSNTEGGLPVYEPTEFFYGSMKTAFCIQNKIPLVPGGIDINIPVSTTSDATAVNANLLDDGLGNLAGTGGTGLIDYIYGIFEIEIESAVPNSHINTSLLPTFPFGLTGKYVDIVNDFPNWNAMRFSEDGREPAAKPGDIVVIYDSVDSGKEEMALITDLVVESDHTQITINTPLVYDHAIDTTLISTVLETGTLQCAVQETFTQETWDFATWTDEQEGDPAYGNYDFANYPCLVSNAGCTTQRWLLRVVSISPFAVDIIGEHVGTIAENLQCQYILGDLNHEDERYHLKNPNTGKPYFTLEPQGWGNGVLEGQGAANWQVGNILRINTEGAEAPFWLMRTIKPSPSEITEDRATIQIRGDVEVIAAT